MAWTIILIERRFFGTMNEGSTEIRLNRCEPSPGVFRARAGID
jgi:hypothetical protein